MYSNYLVPPACYLPKFYNNQSKLMELCSNGLPPVSIITPNLIATPSYYASGDRYAGESLVTLKTYVDTIVASYRDFHMEEINSFAQSNLPSPVPLPLHCVTILYMHSVACSKENESIFDTLSSIIETGLGELPHTTGFFNMLLNKNTETGYDEGSIEDKIAHMAFPGKKYALQALEFINSTNPENAMLAEQFLSEYHIQVLHALQDAEASLPFINALNPIAHPYEQQALVEKVRTCAAANNVDSNSEDHLVDVIACIGITTQAACADS